MSYVKNKWKIEEIWEDSEGNMGFFNDGKKGKSDPEWVVVDWH